jgi:hypothetical protein
MRLKLQKQSALKFVSRIIPYEQGYNSPQLALGFIPVVKEKIKKQLTFGFYINI